MASLISCPLDIILRVLQCCENFSEVIAITSTCTQLHRIWLHNSSQVILIVGARTTLAFDDALSAVCLRIPVIH